MIIWVTHSVYHEVDEVRQLRATMLITTVLRKARLFKLMELQAVQDRVTVFHQKKSHTVTGGELKSKQRVRLFNYGIE